MQVQLRSYSLVALYTVALSKANELIFPASHLQGGCGGAMRIIAYDRFRPGITMEQITPYLLEEVSNVWRLWKAGIVRENYARADEPGVVIIFEVPDVKTAKIYTDDFPLSKAGLLEWNFIALQVPLPIETLFRQGVDLNPPYDRTLKPNRTESSQ
jgi:hypothetical protein